jgi:hypothetical protein
LVVEISRKYFPGKRGFSSLKKSTENPLINTAEIPKS